MKWAEICEKYEEKWVLLNNVLMDEENMRITEGTVLCHHADKEEVYKKASELRPQKFAIEYVGELPENLAVML